MNPIDFSSNPEIASKISPEEMQSLNSLFSDPTIQKTLEEVELERLSRRKWKIIVWIITFIVGGLLFGITQSINDIAIYGTIGTYCAGMGFLYKKYANKIEVPLKMEVLSHMCPLLYSKLEYSHDEKYSFDCLDLLRSKGFLQSYDMIDKIEDSVRFTMEKDGKKFGVNGFEFESSEMQGSGKNRRRVTTNHCYLIRAIFPYARIPLTDDLIISKDESDTAGGNKLYTGIFFAIVSGVMGFIFTENIVLGILFGGIVGAIIYALIKKYQDKHRVALENIEFEKIFDVHCDDQVTSRMIITPAFMDRLVTFVKNTGNQYEFLFQQNTLFIKRKISGNYLEAGTEKNILTNVSGFARFYLDMKEIIQFIHDMNLLYLSKTDTTLPINMKDLEVTPITFEQGKAGSNNMMLKFINNFGFRF